MFSIFKSQERDVILGQIIQMLNKILATESRKMLNDYYEKYNDNQIISYFYTTVRSYPNTSEFLRGYLGNYKLNGPVPSKDFDRLVRLINLLLQNY